MRANLVTKLVESLGRTDVQFPAKGLLTLQIVVEGSSAVPGTVIERHQYPVGILGGGFLPRGNYSRHR